MYQFLNDFNIDDIEVPPRKKNRLSDQNTNSVIELNAEQTNENIRKVELEKKNELVKGLKEGKYTTRKKTGPCYTANYWQIFREIITNDSKIVNDFICCSNCNKVFTYITKRGTGSLKEHHKNCRNGNTLRSFIERKKVNFTKTDKETVIRAAVDFCSRDMRPFNAIQCDGLGELLFETSVVASKYGKISKESFLELLPAPNTINYNVEKLFNEEKLKLITQIKVALEISIICIAVDMWQDDVNKIHYLGMNAHYLQRDAKNKLLLVSKVMALRSFDAEERKTSNNINRAVLAIIHEYELHSNLDSIVFITDRGANMIASLRDYTRYNCINHMCNNIITHAIEPAKGVISQVSRIVKYMKVNGLNSKLSKTLISYASTRWNTIHDMLHSFITLHNEIGEKIINADLANMFDEIPYDTVVSIRDYLGPYKYVSKETEGDLDVTCVKILPLIETIQELNQSKASDPAIVRQMKTTARSYIKTEIIPHLPTDYKLWAFFHPAWKRMDSFKTVNRSIIVEQIKTSISNIQIQTGLEEADVAPSTEKSCTSIFAKLLDDCSAAPITMQMMKLNIMSTSSFQMH